jgi:HAD superfamily hydrolase (TIGR01509 family)
LDLFDALVTIEDVDRGKPAPDLYLLALNRLNVDPAECVAYEDTDEGVAAATSAGIRCIDVRPILHPTRHHAGDH